MTRTPELETPRLRMRRVEMRDFDAFEAFFADPQASRFVGGPLTPDGAWMRFCAEIGHWSAAGFGVWALEARETAAFAGVVGFWRLEGWGLVELTGFVLPQWRRRGLALEAAQAALTQAHAVWGWPPVETTVRDDNDAARALVARLGGERNRREIFPDGVARDVYRLPPPAPAAAAARRSA